jgi:hypothetical protein
MKKKHAIVIVLIAVLFSTIINSTDSSIVREVNSVPPSGQYTIGNGPVPTEALDLNVAPNPSFEETTSDGIPTGYSAFGTGYQWANMSYQDEVANGLYACLVESKGTEMAIANSYIRNYVIFSPEPYLIDGLRLSFEWNVLANPDILQGSRVFIYIQTTNSTGYTQTLSYYLSHTTLGFSNSSTAGHFYMNDSLNQWKAFDRNITEDYTHVSEFGSYDSSRHITYVWLYAYSLIGASGKIQVVFDDFVLDDGAYSGWFSNGDFELGDGSGWGSYFNSPAYVFQSTDSTIGSHSVELNVPAIQFSSNAFGGLYGILASYPAGYYATSPGATTIEFDWSYNDTPGLRWQYSFLHLTLQYATTTYNVYAYLGHGENNPSTTNSTTNKYVNVTGFGVRNTWQHAIIDVYDYVMMFGSTNMTLYRIEFYTYASEIGGSTTTKIDNLQILTDPTGDPGFEIQWYTSSQTPFAGWYMWNGETGVINRTSDAHSGLIACNLTVQDNDYAGIRRPINLQIDPSLLTDFWWRIDEITNAGVGWAYLELSFNNTYFVTYRLAHSGLYSIPSNTSNVVQLLVDNFNQTGIWNNLVRNITNDVVGAFGQSNWILTRLVVNEYAGPGGRTSLICDDMNFKDGTPPEFTSVTVITNPTLSTTQVELRAVVSDVRPGVSSVTFSYSTGGGWSDVLGTYNENGWFTAFIPAQSVGTEVEFYVTAIDGSGQISIDDNGGSYHSYTVTDITVTTTTSTTITTTNTSGGDILTPILVIGAVGALAIILVVSVVLPRTKKK